MASTIRCSAESAPMVISVPIMSLSIEPTSPAIISAGQAAVAADDDQPVDAKVQQVQHRQAPARSLPEVRRAGGADYRATTVQDAADIVPADRPDTVPAVDQSLVSLVDREDLGPVVQCGADQWRRRPGDEHRGTGG